jgi:diguanylate cyclase (GGDEF)-like protein/putative nucleotidyltransferase with HDIG domain
MLESTQTNRPQLEPHSEAACHGAAPGSGNTPAAEPKASPSPLRLPRPAWIFVISTVVAGSAAIVLSLLNWQSSEDAPKFVCFVLIAVIGSTMKVRLPGMESTLSVSFVFVLLGIVELSLPETIIIGAAGILAQCLWKTKLRPAIIQIAFSICSNSLAIVAATCVYRVCMALLHNSTPLILAAYGLCYFFCNTIMVAIVVSLCARKPISQTWKETYFWSLPFYLIGAAVVGLVHFSMRFIGWQNALLVLPIMYWIYRSYHLYLAKLEDEKMRVEVEEMHVQAEKRHVEEVCALHLRTIEGLALAIDAKDHTTHSHLNRVRTYAVEIAKDLGLSDAELDALRAAALLHDIGKLAVPDHIINKPGRLTPEEFEKMKIHPIVGAEILEKVAFPYPVAPIVRAHHERWNGQGYPDGLQGEDIPIGARILAAADCLDALSSDRQYRKALPLNEAMQQIKSEAGKSFDPCVVEVLERRYLELDQLAAASMNEAEQAGLSYQQTVDRGEKPGAGFASDSVKPTNSKDFLTSIASARQEAHTLFELSQDLGNSLSLDETLSLVAIRLRKLVPYDSIVAFIRKNDLLVPEFVNGDSFRVLSSLEIPIGTGLCGWVARNMRPIVNGNPAVETGFTADPRESGELRSALVVPLEGVNGLVGVLALYQRVSDAFTSDHLRILQVITSRVALFVENALKFREAESSAVIDYLTGIANARGLSLHLEQELARCRREQATAAIIVCDLNGFKQINDCFGHLAGDKVLKQFAASITSVCREYDFAARMGGDEFVIVAPNMTREAFNLRALQFDELARTAGHDVCGIDLLSLSVGAAFFPRDGHEVEQLLAEADRAMYAAKQRHYEKMGATPHTPLLSPALSLRAS